MLTISVDLDQLEHGLTDLEERQIPFATMKALNTMALAGQKAERAHLDEVMTLRRKDWDFKSIKITHFAKKSELYAEISISPPGSSGDQKSDILGKFEDETEKVSRTGGLVAVPVGRNIRRTKYDLPDRRDRPKAFNFHQVGRTVRGDRGTFIVRTANGRGLILQRTRQGVRALYLLLPRVEITPDLAFDATVGGAAEAAADEAFDQAWELAMATAK